MTGKFDFITDDEFRSILTADYEEMFACANSKAWKAVHVLAGSIIEAVIVDYLKAEGLVSCKEAMELQLGSAIDKAKKEEIISQELHNLSAAVKDYRNLVHPGRSIRLKRRPNSNTSSIAMTLVEMICKELGDRRGSHGYTAEQIISKVQKDPSSADAILKYLVKDVSSQKEIKKLLIKIIPETYYETNRLPDYQQETDWRVLPVLKSLFRVTYKQTDDNTQKEVALNFIRIVKEEEDSEVVTVYSETFWWMNQLEHLDNSDMQMIKDYFFSRVGKEDSNVELIKTLSDIGQYLTSEEVPNWIWLLIRRKLWGNREVRNAAAQILQNEHWEIDGNAMSPLLKRLDQLRDRLRESGKGKLADLVEEEKLWIEIPFC